MTAFTELNWRRFDVWAIVGSAGIATIDEVRHPLCLEWLRRNDYQIDTLDCTAGLNQAVVDLGRLFKWESQFGYSLESGKLNLDALNDGFEFDVPESGGRVFEVIRADIVWQADPRWLLGLLSIAKNYSRRELALGRRFFTLLVLPDRSPLIGVKIDETVVPVPWRDLCRELNEFTL